MLEEFIIKFLGFHYFNNHKLKITKLTIKSQLILYIFGNLPGCA